MPSADVAVQVFRQLESEDFRILHIIEAAMNKREFVPVEQIRKYAKVPMDRVDFTLGKLSKLKLLIRTKVAYVGYSLNYVGYDCLALNALVKANIIESLGKSLGVGKEADVYDAMNPDGKRVAIKFHRLGRQSFKQTRRKRGYGLTQERATWLFQSHLAAEKEFQAMQLVYANGVSVPEPISQNRHVIAMGMIEGDQLSKYKQIAQPQKILKEILQNVRKTYTKAHIVHGDLSEYNVILKPDGHILIIDWPQFVKTSQVNVGEYLERDLRNVLTFFTRRFRVKANLKEASDYVTGKTRNISF